MNVVFEELKKRVMTTDNIRAASRLGMQEERRCYVAVVNETDECVLRFAIFACCPNGLVWCKYST